MEQRQLAVAIWLAVAVTVLSSIVVAVAAAADAIAAAFTATVVTQCTRNHSTRIALVIMRKGWNMEICFYINLP